MEKLQGHQVPWGRLGGHTAQSSRPRECPALWPPHPYTAVSPNPHCRTGRMWSYAYFASAFPRIKSQQPLELETGGHFLRGLGVHPQGVELLTFISVSLTGLHPISLSGWCLLPLCGPHPSLPSKAPSTWDRSRFRKSDTANPRIHRTWCHCFK